jgi:transcription-repair coupling factor (superfamily II helicase)
MEFYQRFGEAKSVQKVDEIAGELRERFGILPEQACWLVSSTKIKVFGAQKGFTLIKLESHSLTLERKTGTTSHTNKLLMAFPKTPEDFEKKVMVAIETMAIV